MDKKNIVEIFTDGACRGNPGTGGWGVLLRYQNHEKELFGKEASTTNNRMELTAAIKGLEALKKSSDVCLTTDSKYVQEGMLKWVHTWEKRAWKTADNQAVKNEDLWKKLLELSKKHRITWAWVRGHSGNKENERVDALANKGIDSL